MSSSPASPSDDRVRELEEDRGQAVWVVALSDGTRAAMDAGDAWLRLGAHLRARRLGIRAMWLRFRGTCVQVGPEGAPGYFWRRLAVADSCGGREDFWLAGHLDGDRVVVARYLVPHLALFDVSTRTPESCGASLLTSHEINGMITP